jgi:hypothetical protein
MQGLPCRQPSRWHPPVPRPPSAPTRHPPPATRHPHTRTPATRTPAHPHTRTRSHGHTGTPEHRNTRRPPLPFHPVPSSHPSVPHPSTPSPAYQNSARAAGNCRLRSRPCPESLRAAVLNSARLKIPLLFVRMPLPLTFHCIPLRRATPVAASVREMALRGTSRPAGQTGSSPLQLPHLPAPRRSDLVLIFRRAALRARRSWHPNLQQQKFNPAPQNKRNHA